MVHLQSINLVLQCLEVVKDLHCGARAVLLECIGIITIIPAITDAIVGVVVVVVVLIVASTV